MMIRPQLIRLWADSCWFCYTRVREETAKPREKTAKPREETTKPREETAKPHKETPKRT